MTESEKREDGTTVANIEEAGSERLAALCSNGGKPWWKIPHLVKLNLVLIIPLITSYAAGFDGSMMNGLQSVPVWQEDFDFPSAHMLGIMNTVPIVGSVAALPFAPWLCDRFGRRHTIFYGSLVIIIGVAIQSAANGMAMLVVGRTILGLGGGFTTVAAPPLVAELAFPTHRAIATAIFNTSWYLGSIVAAWVTYRTFRIENSWSWRIPSILQALPSLIQMVFIYFTPESPRWLISRDRTEDATKVLSKYHSGTAEPTELVKHEIAEICVAIEDEKRRNLESWKSFVSTAGNRHRLLVCASLGLITQLCGNTLISYYLVEVLRSVGITDPEDQNLINGILQIFNYLTSVATALFIERAGRRLLFLTSTIGMLIAFIIWTAISAKNEQQGFTNKGLGIGIVVMIFVFFLFYNIAMNAIAVAYIIEILPFSLRTKGYNVFNATSFVAFFINGFANPVALQNIGWRYYIVFVCIIAASIVLIYFTFPETKGLSLEEVGVLFDGKEQVTAVREAAIKKVDNEKEE